MDREKETTVVIRSCSVLRVDRTCFLCVDSKDPSGPRRWSRFERFGIADIEDLGTAVLVVLDTDPLATDPNPPNVLAELISTTGRSSETAFYKAASCVWIESDGLTVDVVAAARRGRGFTGTDESPHYSITRSEVSAKGLGKAIVDGLDASWALSGNQIPVGGGPEMTCAFGVSRSGDSMQIHG